MSDDESWFDSAVDSVSETINEVTEGVSGAYEVASAEVSEGLEKAETSLAAPMREIEESVDTDHDGSLLDDVMGGAVKQLAPEIPVVGEALSDTIGTLGNEYGDMLTDTMGTRQHGMFSEDGTYDASTTTDEDYKPGSAIEQGTEGFGNWVNNELGIGENDPADIALGAAAISPVFAAAGVVGALGEMTQDVEQFERSEPSDEDVSYDDAGGELLE